MRENDQELPTTIRASVFVVVFHLLHHLPAYLHQFGPIYGYWMYPSLLYSSPNSSSNSRRPGNYWSPSKSAELRGKYIHQLRELVDLRDIGALTGEEFEEQQCAIVNLTKNYS